MLRMELVQTSAPRAGSITAYLSADHRRLDERFAEVRALVSRGGWDDARVVLADFIDGLRRHIRLEEEVVFPLFAERARILGPLKVMHVEHRQIEELLGELDRALASRQATHFGAVAAQLAQLVAVHDAKEERILYPKTDQVLAQDERERVAAALERA
jgi:hemerythrin-like domain-containing protein